MGRFFFENELNIYLIIYHIDILKISIIPCVFNFICIFIRFYIGLFAASVKMVVEDKE